MMLTSEIAGRLLIVVSPGREQSGGQQLQHAVLGADHLNLAGQACATGHLQHLHRARLTCPAASSGRASARPLESLSMAVHLTRIYTKTGDDGTTGARRHVAGCAKTDPAGRRLRRLRRDQRRRSASPSRWASWPANFAAVLRAASRTICSTSAPTCARRSRPTRSIRRCGSPTPTSSGSKAGATSSTRGLAKLDSFILPGGTPGAALLHLARTVARRAERSAWALHEAEPERTNHHALLYLNRLSDLLFILARVANPGGDVLWQPGGGEAK